MIFFFFGQVLEASYKECYIDADYYRYLRKSESIFQRRYVYQVLWCKETKSLSKIGIYVSHNCKVQRYIELTLVVAEFSAGLSLPSDSVSLCAGLILSTLW